MRDMKDVVTNINHFFASEFRGKSMGRFKLHRDQLRMLLGVPRIREDMIRDLQDACMKSHLVMIDLDSYFVFMERNILYGYRQVPRTLFGQITGIKYVEDEPEPEDEQTSPEKEAQKKVQREA